MKEFSTISKALTLLASVWVWGCQSPNPSALSQGHPSPSQLLFKDSERIAFLGDSITAGGATYGKYCRLVVHGLKSKGLQVHPILAGIPGNTTQHMLERLDRDVLSRKPDWVILAAGVNDIWHLDPTLKIGVFKPSPGMGVQLEDYKRNVRAIFEQCHQAGARLMLTTITPIMEDPEFKTNVQAKSYNAFLRAFAKEKNLPIASLREAMFAEISKGTRLTSDGVHPLTIGHQVMAKGLLKEIGLTEEELDQLQGEWDRSPSTLVLGDIQTTSGGRTGGWCHLLMDALNSGQDMMTFNSFARYRGTVTMESLSKYKTPVQNTRYLVIQAPWGDIEKGTEPNQYRRQVEHLIQRAKKKHITPILVTHYLQGNQPDSQENRKAEPYDKILRLVAQKEKVTLADINSVMGEHLQKHPKEALSFDKTRFNRRGSVLMVETLLKAMNKTAWITPELRSVWSERGFYAEK